MVEGLVRQETNRRSSQTCNLLRLVSLFSSSFDPEDGCVIFLRNVRRPPNYAALQPRKPYPLIPKENCWYYKPHRITSRETVNLRSAFYKVPRYVIFFFVHLFNVSCVQVRFVICFHVIL
jgi:hypothetical protein